MVARGYEFFPEDISEEQGVVEILYTRFQSPDITTCWTPSGDMLVVTVKPSILVDKTLEDSLLSIKPPFQVTSHESDRQTTTLRLSKTHYAERTPLTSARG